MKQFFKTDKNSQRTNVTKSTVVNGVRKGLSVCSIFDRMWVAAKGFNFDVETI